MSADQIASEGLKLEGNRLFKAGKYGAAIEKYTEAITMSPKWPVLLVNRALCYKRKEDWEKMESDCLKALLMDPDLHKAHFYLGQALAKKQRWDEAIRHLTKALEVARELDDSIKDEVWRQLARAKYAQWEVQYETRKIERKQLRTRLHALLLDAQTSEQKKTSTNLQDQHRSELDLLDQLLPAVEVTPHELAGPFTCRITLEIFREPVICPSGLSYEKTALLEHLRKNGNFDPVTRKPMTERDIVLNLDLRAATQHYLDEHPWAWKDCF